MNSKRSYHDGCAGAHALDLIGERWAMLVVRELLLGPKRFTDLRGGLPGISPNVLTQRLIDLEQAAIVQRRKLPPPAAAWVYELTAWGQELEPVLQQLGRWGARSPCLPRDAPLGVDSLILSFRTMFDPAAAGGLDTHIELRIGEDRFEAIVAGGQLQLQRGSAQCPAAIVTASAATLAALAYGGHRLSDAVRQGTLTVSGDTSAVQQFLRSFPLPGAAPAAAPRAPAE